MDIDHAASGFSRTSPDGFPEREGLRHVDELDARLTAGAERWASSDAGAAT
jgi:hypothetical protein